MAQFSQWLSIVISIISLSMVSGKHSTQDECYFNRISILKVGNWIGNDFVLEKLNFILIFPLSVARDDKLCPSLHQHRPDV